MKAISVAFVDDHPVLLSGLSQLFSGSSDFNVVAVGQTAKDIVDIAGAPRPDVIVVDLSMPGNVIEAIAEVTGSRGPAGSGSGGGGSCSGGAGGGGQSKVLVFTASTTIDSAIRTLEAGAVGYVLKGSTIEELATAIRKVHQGEMFITPNFATAVIAGLRERAQSGARPRIRFSPREEQVLRLLLNGSTNKEIATALRISDKTVKHYMSVLMQKLNVRNRLEVVLAAQELRVGEPLPQRTRVN